jgi:hypothetical protein
LVQLGGEATVAELEEKAAPLLAGVLHPEEMNVMSGDKFRWKLALRRSRRHMIKEGFLEDHSGLRWRITESGRETAKLASPPN